MKIDRVFRALVFTMVLVAASPAWAAASLSVTPTTWNVVGLDSNNPNVGPNHFPTGARVCNTGDAPATDVTATFKWDTTDTYIKLRPGTNSVLSVATLVAGSCQDFYFEVEVTRSGSAYDHKARYYVEVTSTVPGTTITTPRPREIYVEHLVSQARNSVSDLKVGETIPTLTSVPNGGTMTLLVGNSYYIRLIGATATQGYQQAESFLTLPNTIFQMLSVQTIYSADTSAYVANPSDLAYGDACSWENDPDSPNYRSCHDDGKVGGSIEVTYHIKVLGVGAANPETMSTLIYDFSGSSFHYNGDYEVASRSVYVLSASGVGINKTFVADAIVPGATSTMNIRITNPGTSNITGVNFAETFPATMVIAPTPNASTTGCGTPTFSPTAGAGSISFSNGTLSPSDSCTIKVDVTAPAVGTYTSTTDHLFINGTTDTGNSATDDLVVSATVVACTNGTMASWTVPVGTAANPPDVAGGIPTTKAGNVATATLSALLPASTAIVTTGGQGDTTSWRTYGYKTVNQQYVNIVLQTKNYSNVSMSFYVANDGAANGPTQLVVSYDAGSGFTDILTVTNPAAAFTQHVIDFTGLTSTAGNTTVRFRATGANTDGLGGSLHYDNFVFTGCSYTPPPSMSKSFGTDPVRRNTDTSTLTFALSNTASSPYSALPITGVTFTDTMPTDLIVATPSNAGTNCTTGVVAATSGTSVISLTGANMAAAGTCSVWVDIKGTAGGVFDNVSDYIDSNESSPNKSAGGYGTDSLTVLAPPSISMAFAATPILTSASTTLSFTVTNPNSTTTLTGMAFSDSLPAGVEVIGGSSSQCGGTVTTTAPSTIALSGGSLAALASCTFNVTVSGTAAGTKNNTTGTISATNGGTGNSASATLVVKDASPAIGMLKQLGPTASGPWSSFRPVATGAPVYYQFTVENVGDVPLSTVTVTDDTLTMTCAAWPNLPVADATDDDHIATCVLGPFVASSGSHVNTSTAHGWYGGNEVTDTSSATYATTGLTLAKSATETSFSVVGDLLHYSYLVTNSGYAALVGPVTVADDKATVTCPALTTVGDNDNYLDATESITCTATYAVTAGDVTAGSVTNNATAAASGFSSSLASKTINILASCGQPANPTNGTYASCNPTASGGTCALTCSGGYTASGNALCTVGAWSTESCDPDPCLSQPVDPGNGTYAWCNPTASGGTCALTCFAGYTESGDALCSAGTWSTESCTPNPCASQPANPTNGTYASCNPTASGGTCALTCFAGYTESGDALCTAGGWTTEVCTPACISNADCTAPTPVCDVQVSTCVECLLHTDCPSGLCNTVDNTCIYGCVSNTDCFGAKPLCNTSDNLCVECLISSNCALGVCEPESNTCVECVLSADCPPTAECHPGAHLCVPTGCTVVNTCAAPTPVCDPAKDFCVECLVDSDCANPTPVCDSTVDACVECVEHSDCGGVNPFCDVGGHRCVACLSDADCVGDVCHPTANMCVECAGDGDCPGGVCKFITFTCEPVKECGNSVVEAGEGCDDGGNVDGDGCNSFCLVEDGQPCNTASVGVAGHASCASGACDTSHGTPGSCTSEDTDGDGIFDPIDIDDDNDGILDVDEGDGLVDTDGDGVPDSKDLDSDNDGIGDAIEAGHHLGLDVTSCAGGFGTNGLCDALETTPDSGKPDYDGDGVEDGVPRDTDGDSVADFRDLDSDNDGLDDVIEAGHEIGDDDGNGLMDCLGGYGVNGICDALETYPDSGEFDHNGDGTADGKPRDTDGDGVADFRDLDSDNDGLNDAIEANIICDGAAEDGVCDGPDSDGDGIVDSADGAPGTFGDHNIEQPPDTDDDGVPDYRDLDSDNDGISDLVEGGSGCVDVPIDGVCDGPDSDGDGIVDSADDAPGVFGDGGAAPPTDTDGDGTPDFRDLDSDDDGVMDVVEGGHGGLDGDGDGVIDDPIDLDGDGIADVVDDLLAAFGGLSNLGLDTDGDGVVDFQDPAAPDGGQFADSIGISGGGCSAVSKDGLLPTLGMLILAALGTMIRRRRGLRRSSMEWPMGRSQT